MILNCPRCFVVFVVAMLVLLVGGIAWTPLLWAALALVVVMIVVLWVPDLVELWKKGWRA